MPFLFSQQAILDEILAIPSGDPIEEEARSLAYDLLSGGAPLIRDSISNPSPHLVVYFVVTDGENFLLCNHIKAGLWLPTGGHVDQNEHPRETALREHREELGCDGAFYVNGAQFISLQETRGADPHEDLTLWYLLSGSQDTRYNWDLKEFTNLRWFAPKDIPFAEAEPQLERFLYKMRQAQVLPN